MEEAGHELCFISHPKNNKRIRCNVFGSLSPNRDWGGWEVWRFIKNEENGNFVITSRTHEQMVLCSNEAGEISTADKEKLVSDGKLKAEEWKITLHPESEGVMIQSVKHNRCLAHKNYEGFYMSEKLKDTVWHRFLLSFGYNLDEEKDTVWHLEPAHRNQFFVSSICRDKRLSSTKNNELVTSDTKEASGQWVIEPTNEKIGHFTIRSLLHSKYLGLSEDGTPIVGESKENWMIGISPHGGVFIQMPVENGGFLSCNFNGHPCIASTNSSSETWSLKPIMPESMNSSQFWSRVGIGAAAITAAIAMPFAVTGVVGLMGFGSAGIGTGSMAAGMMSAEAIVSGGAIAAGGTVATLQSIGAVGLSVAGTSAAAGAGAVVGGLSSLAVVTANKGLDKEEQKIKLDEPEKHLPLCSWRMWEHSQQPRTVIPTLSFSALAESGIVANFALPSLVVGVMWMLLTSPS